MVLGMFDMRFLIQSDYRSNEKQHGFLNPYNLDINIIKLLYLDVTLLLYYIFKIYFNQLIYKLEHLFIAVFVVYYPKFVNVVLLMIL